MRIIAGTYRSRQIQTVPGNDVRPTTDMLRETLFNVVSSARPIEDTVWLDVYAGSGAVGIEALSRGARQVYFIESSRKAVTVIRKNLAALKIESGFEVLERDADAALRRLDSQAIACDVCFLDPPYALEEEYEDTLGFLSQSQMIGPQSLVIAEHSKRHDPGDQVGALVRFRNLKQGDAVLSFYRKQ
ncbi:MAG: 16S rRNA (guanine(966)-N(2))-methyltransferase RsmD [Terriglobales bacterium]